MYLENDYPPHTTMKSPVKFDLTDITTMTRENIRRSIYEGSHLTHSEEGGVAQSLLNFSDKEPLAALDKVTKNNEAFAAPPSNTLG